MKTNSRILRNMILLSAAVLAFSSGRANGQGAATAQSSTQQKLVPARVTEAVDDAKTVTLKGNVHPLARAEFDQGPVSDAMPATRMLLLLQRSTEQEATLRQLLEDQQNKASANFHKWLTPEQYGAQF